LVTWTTTIAFQFGPEDDVEADTILTTGPLDGAVTVTLFASLSGSPSSSVTVSVTVRVPDPLYVWLVVG
jgi:hypothetical protein